MSKIEYNYIIKNKTQLLKQLKSLKKDAAYSMRSSDFMYEVYQKDFHALRIAIKYIKENVK